jgi:hypothetical protein
MNFFQDKRLIHTPVTTSPDDIQVTYPQSPAGKQLSW